MSGYFTKETKVAGVTFEKRQETLKGMAKIQAKGAYTDLVLVHERGNKFDKNAVKVIARWYKDKALKRTMIGYVPAKDAVEIAAAMDAGEYVKVETFALKKGSKYGVTMTLAGCTPA